MNNLQLAGNTRIDILRAALVAGKYGAHIASSLSLVEIGLAILKNYKKGVDTFILSKGHGALGYYAIMHQLKMITDEQFNSFESDGGDFPDHPTRTPQNGVEYSGGTLGLGLSYATGTALAKKLRGGGAYICHCRRRRIKRGQQLGVSFNCKPFKIR